MRAEAIKEKHPDELYAICRTDNNYWRHYRASTKLTIDELSMMICKEVEEGSRVLEVIWVVVNLRVIMRIIMMICKEEEAVARVLVVGILRCCLGL